MLRRLYNPLVSNHKLMISKYALMCLLSLFAFPCHGRNKNASMPKDTAYVNRKLMDEQALIQTSILEEYGKENGYKAPTYQEFQDRCMEYWGISLHKKAQDHTVNIGLCIEYTINEVGRFIFTEAEGLFDQPEKEEDPTEEDAKRVLFTRENGIGEKFLAYNKLLFNDNAATLSFFLNNPEYAIDIVFNIDYERNKMLMTKSIDFAKNVPNHSFYRDCAESILFYNNKKRGFRRNLIAEIFRMSNRTNETMTPFDDLVYAYFELFTKLKYAQQVKDACLAYLMACLIEYDTKNKDNIGGIKDEKAYQHLSNFMSKDKHLAHRLKKNNYYGNSQLKELVAAVLVMENAIDPNDTYFVDDPDGYANLRERASSTSKIIKRVATNEMLTILNNDGQWWKVQTKDGTTGYIHKSRIRCALKTNLLK